MPGDTTQDRQQRLTRVPIIPRTVGVIGVGGIGFYVAQGCALAGVKRIVIFDSDHVDTTNLNRLPYPPEWIGKPKIEAFEEYIAKVLPKTTDFKLDTHGAINDEEDMWPLDDCEFIFITADSGKARNMITAYCNSKEIPYINVGYDGNHISLYKRMFSSRGDEGDTYTVTPSWAAPTMVIAGMAMYWMAYPITSQNPFSMNILDTLGMQEEHTCPECGTHTVNPWELDNHVIFCPMCRKGHHTEEKFMQHLKIICPDCRRGFCIKRVSDAHAKFKCACGYKSCIKDELTKHISEGVRGCKEVAVTTSDDEEDD